MLPFLAGLIIGLWLPDLLAYATAPKYKLIEGLD